MIRLKKYCETLLIELKNHPDFDEILFEENNIEALCKVGGDICTITIWALRLHEALKNEKT